MLGAMIYRNVKLFFKDKGMFFSSLITPIILLVLYATFLGNVYKNSLLDSIPQGMDIADNLVSSFVGGQLVSSILAVCCVTVAFYSNMLMVQDKMSGARGDLTVSPVKSSVLSLSYFISSAMTTLIIGIVSLCAGLLYLTSCGWVFDTADVMYLACDVVLLVLFGTALSSIVNVFVTSQGQITAIGAIISAGYGFICGAYMPISQFGEGLQVFISFLPGTYGTSLIRNHTMHSVFAEMTKAGLPDEFVDALKELVDCKLTFLGNDVSITGMYLFLGVSVAVLIALYVFLSFLRGKKNAV